MTLYQLAKRAGLKLTTEHLLKGGLMVSNKAIEMGVSYTKIGQQEGENYYQVNNYPDSFQQTMTDVLIKYLQNRK